MSEIGIEHVLSLLQIAASLIFIPLMSKFASLERANDELTKAISELKVMMYRDFVQKHKWPTIEEE